MALRSQRSGRANVVALRSQRSGRANVVALHSKRIDRANAVTLRWSSAAGATMARRQRERTKEFKDGYRLRSGIEATNSEYKRFYGGGRFRNEAEITSRFAGPRE